MESWLKLWRKSMDSEVFADANLWKVWCWCLMRAAYKTRHVPIRTGRGETIVTLEPGQFIYGRNAASKALKMPGMSIERRLSKLIKMGNCVRQVDTHYSVVSIANWDTYNGPETQNGQASGQATVRQRSGNGHIQEVQEGKEERQDAVASSSTPVDPEDDLPPVSLNFEACPYSEIQAYWNSKPRLKANHPCQQIGAARKRSLRARWQDADFRARWQEVVDNCEASDFLMSDCNPFDFLWWVKNDRNWVKILEGKYANKTITEVEVWMPPEK